MTAEDILAEVTDPEIEDLLRARAAENREIERLLDALDRETLRFNLRTAMQADGRSAAKLGEDLLDGYVKGGHRVRRMLARGWGSPEDIQALADGLGVTSAWLLFGE